jgi:hypothetical protein
MMKWQRIVAAVVLAGISAALLASAAEGGPSATKQRVAIEIRFVLATGKGTFTLMPLSRGPLKKDSGTLIGSGVPQKPIINELGQKVIRLKGADSHTGRNGTFQLVQQVEGVQAARGWLCDTGTWTFRKGTGAYEGVTGRGAFTAVGPPGAVLYAREEGYLITP